MFYDPPPTHQPKSTGKKTLYSMTGLKTNKNIRGIAQVGVSGGCQVDVARCSEGEIVAYFPDLCFQCADRKRLSFLDHPFRPDYSLPNFGD